jgi:UDP-glucuronate decarboxylase
LVDALTRFVGLGDEITGPINLGNPEECTMISLAERIIELTNSKSRIEYRDLPMDDPKQRMPDITKAQETLHWAPVTSLNDGLEKTIADFIPRLNLEA